MSSTATRSAVRRRRHLLSVAVLALAADSVLAANKTANLSTGTSANWSQLPWSPAGVPAPGDDVTVTSSVPGGFGLYLDSNTNYSTASPLASATFNGAASPLNIFSELFGISFSTAGNLVVAGTGNATFSQSAGNVAAGGDLILGQAAGSTGAYSLSSSFASLSAFVLEVGVSGTGAISQSAGSVSAAGLTLAAQPGSSASYSLTGGTLTSGNDYLGFRGAASFSQSAGTYTTANLQLAFNLGSSASYSLSDGSLSATNIFVRPNSTFTQTGGSLSFSTFTQTGGTVSLSTSLGFSSDIYVLSGGTLSTTHLRLGDLVDRFIWTGGTLSLTNDVYIYPGTDSGLDSSLIVLSHPEQTLTAPGISIGEYNGAGTLAQSAGHVTASDYLKVVHGSYSLSGGTFSLLNPNQPAVIGYNNDPYNHDEATFSISGTASASFAGKITVLPTGHLVLSGGSLSVVDALDLDLSNDPSRFSWTGGTLSFNNGYTIGNSFPLGPTVYLGSGMGLGAAAPSTNNGTIIMDPGSSLVGTQTFLVNNGLIAGAGTVSIPLSNAGSIVAGPGTLAFSSNLTNLAFGTITVRPNSTLSFAPSFTNSGAILINGGTLSATQSITNYNTIQGHGLLSTPSLVNNGSIAVTGGALTFAGSLTGTGSLYVDPFSSLVIPGALAQSLLTLRGPASVGAPSSLGTLAIDAPTGSLDLKSQPLTLASITPATLRSYLLAGQLTSSTPDSLDLLSLGYLTTAGNTLVQLTYTGDANLDGVLNADDFALIDLGFATQASLWQQGDFNYDGQITAADYLLIDRTYALLSGPLSPDFLSLRQAQFGQAYVDSLLTSIPEPLFATWLIAVLPLISRRRGRSPHISPGIHFIE